jgi:hypothetical protein
MELHTMDHDSAVKSQACEKYLLGELSPELRDAYEDHYFSCAECAMQLRSAVETLGSARQIFAEQPAVVTRPASAPASAGWFQWLRPAFAVPAFAALLLLVGYQNFVTIPQLKQSGSPRVLQMFSLITANSRGEGLPEISAAPNEPIGLYVDVPSDPAFATYDLLLQDPTGKTTLHRSLAEVEAQKTQVVVINPGTTPGKYTLLVNASPKSGPPAPEKELTRIQFTVVLSAQVQQ